MAGAAKDDPVPLICAGVAFGSTAGVRRDDPVPLVPLLFNAVERRPCFPAPELVGDDDPAPLLPLAGAAVVEVVEVVAVFGACSAPATGDIARTDTVERRAMPMALRLNVLAPARRRVFMADWISTILGASLILRPRRSL
jgi:hypothetical protein